MCASYTAHCTVCTTTKVVVVLLLFRFILFYFIFSLSPYSRVVFCARRHLHTELHIIIIFAHIVAAYPHIFTMRPKEWTHAVSGLCVIQCAYMCRIGVRYEWIRIREKKFYGESGQNVMWSDKRLGELFVFVWHTRGNQPILYKIDPSVFLVIRCFFFLHFPFRNATESILKWRGIRCLHFNDRTRYCTLPPTPP